MYLIAIDKKIISYIVKWKKIALRHDGIFAEKLYFSILTTTLLIINQKGFKFDNENRNVKMIYLKRSVFKKIAKNDLQIHDQKKKDFFLPLDMVNFSPKIHEYWYYFLPI